MKPSVGVLKSAIALFCIWGVLPSRAHAQTQSCNINNSGNNQECETTAIPVAFSINAVVQLTVVQGATFNLLPAGGLLSATDYDNGFFNADGSIQLQVRANAPWTAKIASVANFTGGCPQLKSASTLKWGTTSATRSAALSTTASAVFSGAATAGSTQDVFFRVDIGWTSDAPVTLAASCRLPVTFSATTP